MPLYDYRCATCNATTEFFTRSVFDVLEPVCPRCGSREMTRLVSRFAYHKSLQAVHAESGPPPAPGDPSLDYYQDPRNIGRHVEESLAKYDMEVPESVREKIDAAREGVMPKELDL